MEALRSSTAVLAALALLTVTLAASAPVQADMHAACDTQEPAAEGGFGPAAYANVWLVREGPDDGFSYGGGVYCPGAVVTIESVTVTDLEADDQVDTTAAGPCTSDPATACTAEDSLTSLAPGHYEVTMLFDIEDPNAPGDAYDDTPRTQRFAWLGAGTPVLTCPDVGWVHGNPPVCPSP